MTENKELKRTYNIPLRHWFSKKPKYRRAKVAIKAVKSFLEKHMKSDDVKLGPMLNEKVWNNGIKNPPHHIKIEAIKDKDGAVTAELFGHKYISNKIEEKKETFKDRLMSKVGGPEKTVMKKVKEPVSEKKTEEKPKVEVKKEEVKTETKKVEEKPTEPVKEDLSEEEIKA